jgi:multidrug efflux system outer membrane protein
MSAQASKIQAVRMLQNQTKVLLLPFIRGEGRDEGLLVRARGRGAGSLFRARVPHETSHFRFLLAAILPALLLFYGCAVGPKYERPKVDAPPEFRGENMHTNLSMAELPWWEIFQDDTLQDLIRIALTNNYDVRIAAARVEQAQAQVAQTRSQFFPQLNYNALVGRGKNSSGTVLVSGSRETVNVFGFDGTASWELDLWGRIRRLNEASRAQFFANREARRDVTVSLISQVAQGYFQLLALDRELEIARRTTNAFGESLRIFTSRLQQGVVSKLETSSAEALLASTAATVPELERLVLIQENALNVLLGRNPGSIARPHTLLEQTLPGEVPAGLPSTLLERRPDIREAEQNLRAANARVGASVADFFPKLSLTALLGQVSPELSAVTGGGAAAWNVAAGLTGPLFQGGRLIGAYHQNLALREESALRYQQTILNAFQEVSNALISRRTYAEARQQHARAVQAYTTAVQVSRERYVAGRAGYYELLQEQQLLLPAENSLVETQLNELLALVQLYRALGGGWQN